MDVFAGEVIGLRDGRVVLVTDAASPEFGDYVTYDEHSHFAVSALPPETIFSGDLIYRTRHFGRPKEYPEDSRPRVVSDMSEVLFKVNLNGVLES